MLDLVLCDAFSETARIRVLKFRHAEGQKLPAYTPGAHLDFDLGEQGIRSYSLIDWPGNSEPQAYTIAVQREDDGQGGSQAMHDLAVGAHITATEPRNDFALDTGSAPVLLLAGGIGVTPLISMATALVQQGRDFQFHYTARNKALMGFQASLSNHFDMRLYFDDVQPLDLNALFSEQKPGVHIYLCGPRGMIDATRSAACAAGHKEADIHIELFATPEAGAEDAPFEVEISDTGEVFTIPVGKTIIEVLEEAGKDLMYDCQRGDCGICQTDVISGEPDHRDVVLSESDRASGKVMQICVSRAKTSRLVLDL